MTNKVRELQDARVTYVSIVERGAIREPFRIVKDADGPGLDLNTIFKGDDGVLSAEQVTKSAEGGPPAMQPRITLLSVADENDLELLSEGLEALGFDLSDRQDVDGAIVFKQDADIPADTVVLQLAPGVFIGVSNGTVYKADASGSLFNDVLNDLPAVPSFAGAREILGDVTAAILAEAEDEAQAGELIRKANDDYTAFTNKLTALMPVQALRLDGWLADIMAGAESDDTVQKGDDDGDTSDQNNVEPVPGDKVVKGDDTDASAAMTASIEKLMGPVLDGLSKIAATQEALGNSVNALGERVTKAEGSLKSTTLGGKPAPDTVKKSDNAAGGLDGGFSFDTGMGHQV